MKNETYDIRILSEKGMKNYEHNITYHGSRFGTGIKQLEPVDASNYIIMDYSIHDAIEAGFNHVVLTTYYPKEFQMNTAFSKANIIEESGSRHGIKGGFLYFDKYALDAIRKIADTTEGHSVTDYYEDEKYYFTINTVTNPAITLIFDKNVIEYDYKAIKTQIYKLIRVEH